MGPVISEFPLPLTEAPGLDLPTEIGRSGTVVLRFGGISSEKSGNATGSRGRGFGELPLDVGPTLWSFESTRPLETGRPVIVTAAGADIRRVGVAGRVGVDGREFDLTEFAVI